MNKIASIIVASFALVFSGLVAAPAAADSHELTFVDAFVAPDPSLDGCSMGNSIKLAGNLDKIEWSIDGKPLQLTPQSAQLFYPDGFSGVITATSTVPGVDLFEISAQRRGQSLSWEIVVTPTSDDCARAAQCDTTQRVDELTTQLAVAQTKIERQRATIKRLRAKLQRR